MRSAKLLVTICVLTLCVFFYWQFDTTNKECKAQGDRIIAAALLQAEQMLSPQERIPIESLFKKSSGDGANSCLFKIEFHNDTGTDLEVYLDWISHPYNTPRPFVLAGGEIDAGETWPLEYDYLCGEYIIRWINGDTSYVHGFQQKPYHDNPRVFTPPEEWK